MADRPPTDGEPGARRPDGDGELRDLAAFASRRDEAAAAVADLERQIADLSARLAPTLEAATAVLGSVRWKIGDLVVHRVAKRLLRRPNLAAPWAPERLAEVGKAFAVWERERETGGRARPDLLPETAASAGGSVLVAGEAELAALLDAVDAARADLSLLISWLEKGQESLDEIIGSRRWQVGEILVGWPNRWLGRGRVARALARMEESRRWFASWKRGAGRRHFDALVAGVSEQRVLGPPSERPRIGEWHPRTVYRPVTSSREGISIVVLNRDGGRHLHNLFASFLDHNTHSEVELIVVDHGSTDDSRAVVGRFAAELPIRLLPYEVNNSFSFGNNRGAEAAGGSYLFFLNNDVVFERDILAGLLAELESTGAGAVGAALRYPSYYEVSPGELQHAGIGFRRDPAFCFFRPFNRTRFGESPPGSSSPSPAVTGAALFCRREDFLAAGGFDEGYVYGYEDVDLCLRLRSRGLLSVVARDLELIHDESSTQRTQTSDELRRRRLGNITRLAGRFGYAVKRGFWSDLVTGGRFWTDQPLRVGFAVDDKGSDAVAGDFFTASELARACARELGWETRYLARRDLSADWYDVAHLDLLIVMLDDYDLHRIRRRMPGLITVAWMRNWFDRWASRPWFDLFDLYLCASRKAADYIRAEHGQAAEVLRIATDPERFAPGKTDPELASDYCFTGNYWNAERDLEGLRPSRIDADFALFGRGWADHGRFRRYRRGLVPYAGIHRVYRSTRLVVDDANHVTKPWGSVNSRVFDALASGTLVITNGGEGSREVFAGALPSYERPEELESLVRRYLSDDDARRKLAAQLRAVVLAHHTYDHRARELRDLLTAFVRDRFRVALKVPCPREEEKHHWGDYHMAVALARRFERAGHSVRIDLLPDWDTSDRIGDDVVLVFRGLSRYEPQPMHINLVWNITHPDRIADEELDGYDHVFVASPAHTRALGERLAVPVSELLQCADPEVFHPQSGDGAAREVLFVGNSRKQKRPIVRDAIDAGLPLSVFGAMWEGLVPARYVEGEHIPNHELHRYYGSAGVLLNDHWPSMREHGFLSNRLFDAGACGACVVSDEAVGLTELFGDAVATYDGTPDDLRAKVESLLADPDRRRAMGRRLREIVLAGHTFDHRAAEILAVAENLHRRRLRGLELGGARDGAEA